MVVRRLLGLFTVFLAVLVLPSVAQAEVKALLVGSNYDAASDRALRLANPLADLRIISNSLRGTSIRDMTVLEEPTGEEWQEGLDNWLNSLTGDDIGLFYFAGHGFQIEGQNFLMSSDGQSLVPLDALVTEVTDRARGAIIIIDACRNNPYAAEDPDYVVEVVRVAGLAEGATRGLEAVDASALREASGGLAQMGNLRGLSAVVFFSTEPGNFAEDGPEPGKGSPFAIEFSKQIDRRQSLDSVFRRTAIAVNERTENRQSPWRQGDLAFDVFIAGMRALPIP